MDPMQSPLIPDKAEKQPSINAPLAGLGTQLGTS
jgi:hypothetical protein